MLKPLKTLAYLFIIIAAIIGLLIWAEPILKPLVFALFFTAMLLPLQRRYEKWIPFKLVASLATILSVIVPFLAIATLLYFQFKQIFVEMPSLAEKIEMGQRELINWINTSTPFTIVENPPEQKSTLQEFLGSIFANLGSSISSTLFTLGSFLLTLIYIFFLLWYRTAFYQFLRIQFIDEKRKKMDTIVNKSVSMTSSYLYGLAIVIIVVGILNSIGLSIIGVKYAIFWGFTAAAFTIVPYFGTTLGMTLPFLYALATADEMWKPFAVVIYFFIVQQVEGNFITPKIVGDSVKVNPFAAILMMTVSGFIWGIAGIVLAIPFIAVLRIFCMEIEELRPLGIVLSSSITSADKTIADDYDSRKFRIKRLFRSKLPPDQ